MKGNSLITLIAAACLVAACQEEDGQETPSASSVKTGEASNISYFSATVSGSVTLEGCSDPLVYSQDGQPYAYIIYGTEDSIRELLSPDFPEGTKNFDLVECGTDGSFSAELTELEYDTRYYYFAARTYGSMYCGKLKSFKTKNFSEGPVDMGLSVKWASRNLGASKVEEYGDYYAWGDVEPYYSSLNPIKWKEGKSGYNWESYKYLTADGFWNGKYYIQLEGYWRCEGEADGKTDYKDYSYKDDPARHVLGGSWRTPSDVEWLELKENCTWSWMGANGVYGLLATSKINGNSIFLPVGGRFFGSREKPSEKGEVGYYWASCVEAECPSHGWAIRLKEGNVFKNDFSERCEGNTVRAVTK